MTLASNFLFPHGVLNNTADTGSMRAGSSDLRPVLQINTGSLLSSDKPAAYFAPSPLTEFRKIFEASKSSASPKLDNLDFASMISDPVNTSYQSTISPVIQHGFDVTKGLIGLGIYFDAPALSAVNSTSPGGFTLPVGLDLSFLDDEYDYPVEGSSDSININMDNVAPTKTSKFKESFSPLEAYLSPALDVSLTNSKNGFTTPPNTPVLGYCFAEDGGHKEDLHNLMFDEAAMCVLPDYLIAQVCREENLTVSTTEPVYVESGLVESPVEMPNL